MFNEDIGWLLFSFSIVFVSTLLSLLFVVTGSAATVSLAVLLIVASLTLLSTVVVLLASSAAHTAPTVTSNVISVNTKNIFLMFFVIFFSTHNFLFDDKIIVYPGLWFY